MRLPRAITKMGLGNFEYDHVVADAIEGKVRGGGSRLDYLDLRANDATVRFSSKYEGNIHALIRPISGTLEEFFHGDTDVKQWKSLETDERGHSNERFNAEIHVGDTD